MEYKFTFYAYPLDADTAEQLRAKLEEQILQTVESSGLFMGPVLAEVSPQEAADDEQQKETGPGSL